MGAINLKKVKDTKEVRIALTGKMRSGKDSLAFSILQNLIKVGFYPSTFTFGEGLKYYSKQLFPEEFKEESKPRELFQWFGQTMRQRNENIWINHTAKRINKNNEISELAGNKYTLNIITDLRQENEYKWCKENGFAIIKVECDDRIRIERMHGLKDDFAPTDLAHETETFIDSIEADYTVDTTHLKPEELDRVASEVINILLEKGVI